MNNALLCWPVFLSESMVSDRYGELFFALFLLWDCLIQAILLNSAASDTRFCFFSFSPKNLKGFPRHIYRLTEVFSEDSWKTMKSIQCIIREILDAVVLTHFQSCQAMVNCWSEVYKMFGITLDFHSYNANIQNVQAEKMK